MKVAVRLLGIKSVSAEQSCNKTTFFNNEINQTVQATLRKRKLCMAGIGNKLHSQLHNAKNCTNANIVYTCCSIGTDM